MWYNSVLSLAIVEVNPRTTAQVQVQMLIYISNAMINAIIFGIFINLIEFVQTKDQELFEKLDEAK